jgi:tRNA(Ile)-lysidine synthase
MKSGFLNFEERVSQFIGKNYLIVPRGLVLVGVSGGADSMALLAALNALRHDLGISLRAVHFNHRVRREALNDERFVVDSCRQLNIPLTVGRRPGGKIPHLSEDDARQMRFKFFIKESKCSKAQAIALAHTRNDLAETVLMRLMRGSGLYGLRAILPQRIINGVKFVRPLMGVNRCDVEDYLKLKKMSYCTDNTNQQKVYERNRVRLDLLPRMAKEYNPQIINTLADLASTAAEDYEFLLMHARKQFDKMVIVSGKKITLELKNAGRQHPAILRLIFRQMVEHLSKDPVGLSFEHIHALEHLVALKGEGRLDLPHRLKAVKFKKSLELYYA